MIYGKVCLDYDDLTEELSDSLELACQEVQASCNYLKPRNYFEMMREVISVV